MVKASLEGRLSATAEIHRPYRKEAGHTLAELVDIAEGTRPEIAAPHLTGCKTCREQLGDLRAMMSLAKEADVPEPSPLLWNSVSMPF